MMTCFIPCPYKTRLVVIVIMIMMAGSKFESLCRPEEDDVGWKVTRQLVSACQPILLPVTSNNGGQQMKGRHGKKLKLLQSNSSP